MSACRLIKKTREILEQEEAKLHANTEDHDGDPFVTCVGLFWKFPATRPYMTARFKHADAILLVKSELAVRTALDRFMDMLRLCRGDNQGVRYRVPTLMLRLDQEQECYDFIKWWGNGTKDYDWGDTDLPYLDIHGADFFESLSELFKTSHELTHLVPMTLLKLRLYRDLKAVLEKASYSMGDKHRPIGALVRKKVENMKEEEIRSLMETVKAQYHELIEMVHKENKHFWRIFFDDAVVGRMPPMYALWSPEEAMFARCWTVKAWEESGYILGDISLDTCHLIPVYNPSANPTNTNTNAPRTKGRPSHVAMVCVQYPDFLIETWYGSLLARTGLNRASSSSPTRPSRGTASSRNSSPTASTRAAPSSCWAAASATRASRPSFRACLPASASPGAAGHTRWARRRSCRAPRRWMPPSRRSCRLPTPRRWCLCGMSSRRMSGTGRRRFRARRRWR
jgi:hypothetical protein